jgi:hypothetical protein
MNSHSQQGSPRRRANLPTLARPVTVCLYPRHLEIIAAQIKRFEINRSEYLRILLRLEETGHIVKSEMLARFNSPSHVLENGRAAHSAQSLNFSLYEREVQLLRERVLELSKRRNLIVQIGIEADERLDLVRDELVRQLEQKEAADA